MSRMWLLRQGYNRLTWEKNEEKKIDSLSSGFLSRLFPSLTCDPGHLFHSITRLLGLSLSALFKFMNIFKRRQHAASISSFSIPLSISRLFFLIISFSVFLSPFPSPLFSSLPLSFFSYLPFPLSIYPSISISQSIN